MTLISIGAIASGVGLHAIKTTRKQGIELFGYDFFRLFVQLAILFALSWIIELFMKARVFVELDPTNRPILLGGFFGLGAFLISGLISLFEEKNDEGEVITPINDTIRKLFTNGIEIGGVNLKYWDVIKLLALFYVAFEYFGYMDISKLNGSKVNIGTHFIFGLIIFSLGLVTVPKFTGQIQQVINR